MRKQRKPSWACSHSAKPKRVGGGSTEPSLRQAGTQRRRALAHLSTAYGSSKPSSRIGGLEGFGPALIHSACVTNVTQRKVIIV